MRKLSGVPSYVGSVGTQLGWTLRWESGSSAASGAVGDWDAAEESGVDAGSQ